MLLARFDRCLRILSLVAVGLLSSGDSRAQGQYITSFSLGYYSPLSGVSAYGYGYPSVYSAYRPGYYGGYGSFSTGVILPQMYAYPGGYYPAVGAPYWYGPSYSYYPPMYPAPIYSGGFYPPPVFLPAETMFGPGAVRRFMGVDPPLGTPLANTIVVAPPPSNPPAQPPAPNGAAPNVPPAANVQPRPVSDQLRAHAVNQLHTGDRNFRAAKYHIALQDYKNATTNVPDLVDGYMRQGWAWLAQGQYELAVKAMKKGLQLKPDWPAGQFHLQEIYTDPISKGAHRDALERATRDRPVDPNLAWLAGVFAWGERNNEQARQWLNKARQIESGDKAHIDAFLNALPQVAPAPAPAPADAVPPAAPAAGT